MMKKYSTAKGEYVWLQKTIKIKPDLTRPKKKRRPIVGRNCRQERFLLQQRMIVPFPILRFVNDSHDEPAAR
jgi:hypothetical protein